ncbi:MAG: TetR/AcrR family transcriptional regulator [Spirochaetia bacterium]|nr:TetR/AcrR family transcriptional regulator [Spirochaetia bacterium]
MPRTKSTKKVVTVNIEGRKKNPRPYHHGDLGVAVLEHADEMLERVGIENLSLRDIAASLGVSHAAPYRHFPRKLDLLFALAERGFDALGDAMHEASKAPTPRDRFEMSGLLYVRLAVQHPVRTHLMFSSTIVCEDAPQSLQAAGTRAFQGLLSIIEDGQRDGAFTTAAPAQTLAVAAWSTVHGIASLVSGGQLNQAVKAGGDNFIRSVLDQLFQGVRAPE